MRWRVCLLIALAALATSGARAAELQEVRLWAKAPGEQGAIEAEKIDRSTRDPNVIERVTNVSEPTLTVYPAPSDKGNGVSVIIAPGGAYRFLSWSLEGEEIARWFNRSGITAFVLKYRVPTRAHDPGNRLALMDAQRSVGLVRSRAKDWGLNPAKVGFLGFSAGGHLGANLETNADTRAYDAVDEADKTSCRPDWVALIYPGALLDRQDPAKIAPELKVSGQTPPTFIAVASDDRGCLNPSIRYFEALNAADVKSELHVYTGGGHGFGIRDRAGVSATWPQRTVDWLRTVGILPPQGS
jgi:acetyl esterase/lipase